MQKLDLYKFIDENQADFIELSDKIWEFAEMRFEEAQSATLLMDFLAQEGFSVNKDIDGIPNAFVATFGNDGAQLGFLGEYDALAGLSQKGGVSKKECIVPNGAGHGCGHNMLGVGALAAAVAVKRYLQANSLSGTVKYFGCPGEEGGSGKAYMARAGAFDDLDVALTWHPFSNNGMMSVTTLANYQVYYRFHGRSAHAAAAPHLGRSALDAVELMNVGVNYLREHIVSEARVHYAITNSGGAAPNVVQPEAEVLYLMRAPRLDQVKEIYERICNIARGAALMTGTECEIIFDKACSNYIPNETVEKVMYDNLVAIGAPQFDAADLELSRAIRATLSANDIDNDVKMARDFTAGKYPQLLAQLKSQELSEVILPYVPFAGLLSGSTDVGDVSWNVPTAQVIIACQAFGTPAHSWQTVAQGNTSVAHKGMLTAAKVMAATAVDIIEAPQLIETAKQELQDRLEGEVYVCPIPAEVKPKQFSKK